MKSARLWLLPLAMFATPAWAGKITAELDRTEAELGDAVVLTVTIEGERDGDPSVPDVPGLIVNQQGYSESTVISNGRRVSELALTLVVRAQKAGEYTIPSIVAMLDGQREATLPLSLKFVAAGSGAPPAGGSASSGGTTKAPKGVEDTGGVFVERECANTAPYVGEQVVCAVRIFHRGNLNGAQRPSVNSPDFRRFSIEGDSRYQKVVGGQRYAVIEIKEVMVPTKSGKITLPPFALEARILTWSKKGNPLNKFFDRFGGGMFNFDMNFTEEKQVTVQSEPTEFDVKPLPEANKPTGFQGLVGHYDLRAEISSQQVSVGDTATVTIALSGNGVLDTASEPAAAVSELKKLGKVYPDKPEYKETISGDPGVISSKTFRFAVVPDKAGSFPLGGIDVPVFDPKIGDYVVLHADLGTLVVEQGDVQERSLVVGNGQGTEDRKPVQEVGTDLLGPHSFTTLSAKQTITNAFILTLGGISLAPWIFSFTVLGLRAQKRRRELDSPELRRSKAGKHFHEALQTIKPTTQSSPGQAVADAHKAFRRYVGDKVDRHGEALAAKELEGQLAALGTSESVRTQVAKIVSVLERIEFGGRSVTPAEADALIADLQGVADAMEVK